jgi:integrase
MASIRKRKTSSGEISYNVQIRKRGHKPVVATFKRLEDARKWARDTEGKIERNIYFADDEATRRTLSEAINRYLGEAATQKTSAERKQQLEWWRARIGEKTLAQVTPALLSEQKSELLRQPYRRGKTGKPRKRSHASVNRYMAALSHLLSTAEREWQWISYNPMRRVSRLKEPRGRVRYLSDAERDALLAACAGSPNRNLLPFVTLALLSGARRGELRHLKWSDIDLKRKRAVVHETKNGERRVLHLAQPAVRTLEAHGKVRRLNSIYVFPSEDGKKPAALEEAWRAALKTANLADFRFHDLRHTAASYLAMNGATPGEIAEVLGHKTLAMVKRYSHLSDAHVGSVVDRVMSKVLSK